MRVVATVGLLAAAVAVPPGPSAEADLPAPDPYATVPAVDTDVAANVFETTIVAKTATLDIGNGVSANLWTYNGIVPGPQIRVKVGDTVIVHFRNELPLATGIHWHGIEVPNASDGTSLTQNRIPTNGTFLYKFIVTRPGIYWYHPHHSPTNQVFRGMFGSLLVTDEADDTLVANGVLPSASNTKTLVLSDTTVCKEPGQNDTRTYDPSLPWAGGGPLPNQPGPTPAFLCDRPIDEHGIPITDGNGAPIPLAAGEVPNIQPRIPERMNEGQTALTNGRNVGGRAGNPEAPGSLAANATTLGVAPGEGVRLQMINAAVNRYFRLRLTDNAGHQIPLMRVAGENGLLDDARVEGGIVDSDTAEGMPLLQFDNKYARGEIVLGPSDRADLVMAVPPDAPAGPATLWTLDYSRTGNGYAMLPTVPVAHLNVTGPAITPGYTLPEGSPLRTHPSVMDPVEKLGPNGPDVDGEISPLQEPFLFNPLKLGTSNEEIRLVATGAQTSIDGWAVDHDAEGIDYTAVPHNLATRYARVGDLLELTVKNETSAHHVFHLHGFSFQPLAFEKNPEFINPGGFNGNYTFDYNEFVDSIDVPSRYILRLRVRLDDRPLMNGVTPGGAVGRWVFHCHIFLHSSLGMHAELVVLDPGSDELVTVGNEKPFVDTDATDVNVSEGQMATNTGRFLDPDANPVTLTASTGTVTDIGGGLWSWQHQVTATTERFVYITATDNRGLKSQIAFELHVANVAPTVTIVSPANGAAFAPGTNVAVTATVSDPGGSTGLACRFDWDDGAGFGPSITATDGTCTDARVPPIGVHTVRVMGVDPGGSTGLATTLLVVYGPTSASVTGTGTSSGANTFDINVRYKKGVPNGHVRFLSPTTPLDLRSTGLQWLVVTGSRAQVKGTATVGAAGGYTFLLTVVDNGPDRFRIKVWNPGGTVIYDTVPGAPDDIDTAAPAPIGSGDVIVRT